MKTAISGSTAEWTPEILTLWNERVLPIFKEGETCESANYFPLRPYKNEWDRGSAQHGFCYTVQPGNRVAILYLPTA